MYVIAVYDMKQHRTEKARKLLQKYLNHIQKSVFEGDITEGELKELQSQVKDLVKENTESIRLIIIERKTNYTVHNYGLSPYDDNDQFL